MSVSHRRRPRLPRRPWFVLACALIGCGRISVPPQPSSGESSIRLHVVEGPGGATLALVPVYVNGAGPFRFALDTGASNSLVDQDIAEQLGLPVVGPAVEITGVSTTAEARQVRVAKWKVGEVELPPWTLTSLKMPDSNKRSGLQGLLGSDILSRYRVVTIDYDRQCLLLGSPQ